jgi:hypothetical protein
MGLGWPEHHASDSVSAKHPTTRTSYVRFRLHVGRLEHLVSFRPSHQLLHLFLLHLSRGSADVTTLHAEVTRAWEVATAMEATHITVALDVETSTQEVAMARDSTAIHAKDVDDRATLAEREAWERVLRVKVKNAMVLASAHEGAEGLVQKIALLEVELALAR